MQLRSMRRLTNLLQVFLILVFIGNLATDQTSFIPRISVFICTFIGAMSLNRRYLLWLLAPCLWFEIPTLRLGFPNQFLSDVLILAWTSALSIRFHRFSAQTQSTSIALHPYLLALAAIVSTASLYFIVTLFELNSLSMNGLNPTKLLTSLLHGIFDWNVEDPLHNASVIIGYSIQVLFICRLILHWNDLEFSPNRVYAVILLSATVNALYALGQVTWPSLFPYVFTVDKGGLLQNGNHLSFVCCLALIGMPVLFREASSSAIRFLLFFQGVIVVCGAIVGRGRLPWICFSAVTILFIAWVLSSSSKTSARKFCTWQSIAGLSLFCILSSFALIFTGIWQEAQFFNLFQEISNTVRDKGWSDVIFVGGRQAHFLTAKDALFANVYFGIGLDSFLAKSHHQLAIHNIYFQWLVGLGILGSLPWLAGFFLSLNHIFFRLRKIPHPSFELVISLLSLVYIGAAHLGDVFAAYRSIFTICSLTATVLWVVLQRDRFQMSGEARMPLLLLPLACSALALLSINSPQSIPLWTIHKQETEGDKSFAWNGLYRTEGIAAGVCTKFEIRAPFSTFSQDISAALISPFNMPQPYFNRQQLSNWEARQQDVKLIQSIRPNSWTPFCACALQNDQVLYLSGKYGEILSVSRENFGYDPRFIGFGMSHRVDFPNTEENLNVHCNGNDILANNVGS